jgi:hypothetical protein
MNLAALEREAGGRARAIAGHVSVRHAKHLERDADEQVLRGFDRKLPAPALPLEVGTLVRQARSVRA